MITTSQRFREVFRHVAIGLLIAVAAGCWEEIHYTPPAAEMEAQSADGADGGHRNTRHESSDVPPSMRPRESIASNAEVADEFADDLASSLDTQEPTPATPAPSAAEPVPSAAERVAAPAAPAAGDRRPNSRRAAWLLGSKLSLAAFQNDRGAPAGEVAKWFDQSQSLARLLGVSVSKLPAPTERSSAGDAPDRALDYLFDEGRMIGRDLVSRHGGQVAALFELAVKSNVLLALYQPEAPVVDALTEAIRQSSERAGLPAELTAPLLDQLARGASAAEVQDAVFQLHVEVDRYLSAAVGP